MKPEFEPFPKIPRLEKAVVVTEKLDGTNAQICITEEGEIFAGSRKRWITPQNDNYGFARWVEEHRDELLQLGPGRHFGEWWGQGIQRRYGLEEKRFSLFNTTRWSQDPKLPDCCHLVPVLAHEQFGSMNLEAIMADLQANGSVAAPGFMRPEGIIVYHAASRSLFKRTFEHVNGKHAAA